MVERNLGASVIYAIIAALIGGIVWALIGVLANYELGLVAWAIGGLTGYAVVLAAKDHLTQIHQIIAVIASLIGIISGKYFFFAYLFNDGIAGMFNSFTFSFFLNIFPELFGGMDIVFVILAIVTAWQMPMKFAQQNNTDLSQDEMSA